MEFVDCRTLSRHNPRYVTVLIHWGAGGGWSSRRLGAIVPHRDEPKTFYGEETLKISISISS